MALEVCRCVDDEAELERVTHSLGSICAKKELGTRSDDSSDGITSLSEFCTSVLSFVKREAQPLFDEGDKASCRQADGANDRCERSCGTSQDGQVARDGFIPPRPPTTLPAPLLPKREETFDQAFPSLGMTKAIPREPKVGRGWEICCWW